MRIILTTILMTLMIHYGFAADETLTIKPAKGPGNGKHIVLVSGDEEYRSEEACPMLAKILSVRHGFETTVLFAMNPETGVINPTILTNIPGLEALKTADLVILDTRFRKLPDAQLKHFADYVNSGKPMIGLRTATHAFRCGTYRFDIDWNNFGLNFLGEKWVAHHGKHKVEGARGVLVESTSQHPILNGVDDIFAPSDVYRVKNLDEEKATVLVRAAITETMAPDSKILSQDPRNKRTQAAIWLHKYTAPNGKQGSSLCSTMGASVDFESEGLRRAIVNAAFYLLELDVPKQANVDYVDPYDPSCFSFQPKAFWEGLALKPSDFALGKSPSLGPQRKE
ncbi:MAG: ThuA domain-containing protein [Coraliomargarita sp.]